MSEKGDKSTTNLMCELGMTADDLRSLKWDPPDGWDLIPGTEEIEPLRWVNMATNVWQYADRFFAVTVPVNVGDGDSAEFYGVSIVEVYPQEVTVVQYVTEKTGALEVDEEDRMPA
jgi:hypothetical protein